MKVQYKETENKRKEEKNLFLFITLFPKITLIFTIKLKSQILQKFYKVIYESLAFIQANYKLIKCGHLHDIFSELPTSFQPQPLDELYEHNPRV